MVVEQSGQSTEALAARLALLSRRHSAVAEADRRLADVVAAAHAVTAGALAALDRIESEIEAAVSAHRELGSDAASGARELQCFLIEKTHELAEIVAGASEQCAVKTAVVQELQDSYLKWGSSARE